MHRRFLAHPAELATLEAFAVKLQRRIIAESGLDSHLQDKAVLATVHTDVEAFVYSQPHTTSDCEPCIISSTYQQQFDAMDMHDSMGKCHINYMTGDACQYVCWNIACKARMQR